MEPNNRSRGLKWLTYEYPLVVVAMIFIWVWNSGYLIYFSFSNLIINKKNYCQTFREFRKNLGVGEKSFFRWSYESTPEFCWVLQIIFNIRIKHPREIGSPLKQTFPNVSSVRYFFQRYRIA